MQIIVLGAHRSGTSMVTRLINMMGAYFAMGDVSIGANSENPKGFWERSDVIAANDAILRHYGCEWDSLEKWVFTDATPKKDEAALRPTLDAVKNIVLELDANRPWVVKDPRMCITFPFWRSALEVPVVVCVYRDPQEVARSLKTRNDLPLSHSMGLWEFYATGITNAIRHVPTVFVSHTQLLSDPVATVKKLYDELSVHVERGLQLPSEKEITAFIDPSLYRSRADKAALNDMVSDYQRRLISYVSGSEPAPKELQKPTELAVDMVASLARQNRLQERIESQNQRCSEAEQRGNEFENQIQSLQRQLDGVKDRYEELVNREKAELEFIKQSQSWKIGNKLVRMWYALTFRGSKTA
jgi:hypothetical protein